MPTDWSHIWIPADLGVQVGMNVNKPWRHHLAGGVNHFFRVSLYPANCGDHTIFDSYITQYWFCTRSIDD